MAIKPKIWIAIPVHNRINYTIACLESLYPQSYKNFVPVICDDGSTDGSSEKIKEKFKDAIVLQGDGDLWWTGAINMCVKYVLSQTNRNTDYILTLNNDLEVPEDYLAELVNAAEKYPDSIVSSIGLDIKTKRMVSPGYRQNWLTTKAPEINLKSEHLPDDENIAEVTHAAGRGTLIPVEAFQTIGLYDVKHLPHYGADYDFTHRARKAGYRILVCSSAKVFSHVEETGITEIRKKLSWSGFYRYLTDIKSPANYKTRWWLAVNNCPKLLLPSFLILDFLFIIGSYFKYHFKHV